jgi:hypothetical protein
LTPKLPGMLAGNIATQCFLIVGERPACSDDNAVTGNLALQGF